MNQKYALAVNSVLIFIFTSLVTTIVHEFGHFITAIAFGFHAELHHNYVSFDESGLNDFQKICIAAAGPLTSLVQGLGCLYFAKKMVKKGILSLTILWFGLHGTLCFMGYMMVAPFFINGDTGQVMHLLGIPQAAVIGISIAFVIAIVIVFRQQATAFTPYAEFENQSKKDRANSFFLYPIIIGGIISTLAHYPYPALLSFLAPVMMPFTFFSTYGSFRRKDFAEPTVFINRYSSILMGLTLLSMVAFRLLVFGIKV